MKCSIQEIVCSLFLVTLLTSTAAWSQDDGLETLLGDENSAIQQQKAWNTGNPESDDGFAGVG